jgi:TRAP-type C4-dicarboxylate transport system permease large subunit
LFPIAKAVGIHEVHYAMVVILAMGIGLFAPPFGVGYYAACAIGRVEPVAGMRPILGYMLALVIGTIIVAPCRGSRSVFLSDVVEIADEPSGSERRAAPCFRAS